MSNPPVNRSGEQKIYKQAKILKAGNPQQEVYIYVAVDVVRGYYDGWAYFDRHPDTVEALISRRITAAAALRPALVPTGITASVAAEKPATPRARHHSGWIGERGRGPAVCC